MQTIIPGKNLMIVAHPDDEVLFGFRQLLLGNWHVVCVTNKSNSRRALEFKKVMTILGHTFEMWDHKDEWKGSFDSDLLSKQIIEVRKKGFDHVLTHGPEGEYGHSQHSELFKIVKSLVEKNLLVFDAGESILPFEILRKKMEILSLYESEYKRGLYQWVDAANKNNCMMKFVVFENFRNIY